MSVLSSIEDTIKEHFQGGQAAAPTSVGVSINTDQILEIVNAIVAAAPAIEAGFQSALPFVEAIVEMITNGGQPSDDQWSALRAKLDANSATLADAEAQAQAEIDAAAAAAAGGATGASGPSGGDTGATGATGATGSASGGPASADGGANIVTTHTGINTGASGAAGGSAS